MSDLISRGVELVIFGMGTVFVFLTLLVLATMVMSFLVQQFASEDASIKVGTMVPAGDPTLMAVISAAIKRYREDHPDG